MTQLKRIFKHISPDIPEYKTSQSAGVDLRADIPAPKTIYPGEKSILIPTGISIFLNNPSMVGLIFPRSGSGHKQGLVLGNGTGVIDSDYQGELMISACVRIGHEPVTINPGDRIAQYVVVNCVQLNFIDVEEFTNQTDRGSGGFGSTGT
jgi:dUTP pyrophosphatase